MTNDIDLLRQYVETKSNAAFAGLVERHLGMVYHAAVRQLGNDVHLAKDVTQNVFVTLSARARSLSGHTSLAGWLYTTTHFMVSATLRSERRRRLREHEAFAMSAAADDPQPEADWSRVRQVLDEALLELNPRDREAVLLRFFEGLSLAQMGERLLVSDKGAHKRIERALDRLKDRLGRRGVTSSSAALAAVLKGNAAAAAPAGLAAAVTSASVASAPAGGAAALIQLMSTSKTSFAIAAAAGFLAFAAATLEIHAERAASAKLAASDEAHAALLKRVGSLESEAASGDAAIAGDQARVAALERAAQAKRAAENRARGDTSNYDPTAALAAGKAFTDLHPEVAAALVARSRARALARCGAFFEEAGLTATQINQFEDIIMQGQTFGSNQMQYQVGPRAATDDEINSQLKDLLGSSGYGQYQAYMKTMPMHQADTQLASVLYYTDTPLTGGQAAQLEGAYGSAVASGLNWEQAWTATISKAPGILSAPQLAAFASVSSASGVDEQTWKSMQLGAAPASPVK